MERVLVPWVLVLVAGCATSDPKSEGSSGVDLDDGTAECVGACDESRAPGGLPSITGAVHELVEQIVETHIIRGIDGSTPPSVPEGDADTDVDADTDADADTDTDTDTDVCDCDDVDLDKCCPTPTCDDVNLEECCPTPPEPTCEDLPEGGLECCPEAPPPENRMTGGGIADLASGYRLSHGFEIRCDADDSRQSIEVNWYHNGNGNSYQFHLTDMTSADCTDEGDETPPTAGFTTYTGTGTGTCDNGGTGTIRFVFRDFGEPGRDDELEVHIDCTGNGTDDIDVCPPADSLFGGCVLADGPGDDNDYTKLTGNQQAH